MHYPRVREQIPAQILAAFDLVAAGKSPWPLFISGPAGCGKSCAALYFCDRATGRICMRDFPEICRELQRATMGANWEFGTHGERQVTPEVFWRDWARWDFAVIDELGTRNAVTDFQYESAKRLIDARYDSPTVFISNHGLERIAELFDDRIASRLAGGTVVNVASEDQRLQGVR